MNKICIVTDSTADVPEEYVKKYNIHVIPLSIIYKDVYYDDKTEAKTEQILEWMENGDLPKTSQINPHRFEEEYRKLLNEYDSIISIHISSGLSGTYQSSCIAKEIIGNDNIYCIDSKSVSFGTGLLVIEAAKKVEEGLGASEIYSYIESLVSKVRVAFVVYTLEYLKKGGRISSLRATIGTVLDLKPIVYFTDGTLDILDKPRGIKRAFSSLIKYAENEKIDKKLPIGIGNVGDRNSYDVFEKLVKDKLNISNVVTVDAGACIAVYAGRGTIGIYFFAE